MNEIDLSDLDSLSVTDLRAKLDEINTAGKDLAAEINEAEGARKSELLSVLEQLQAAKADVTGRVAALQAEEAELDARLADVAAGFGDEDEEGEDAAGGEGDESGDDAGEGDAEDSADVADTAKVAVAASRIKVPASRKNKRSIPERVAAAKKKRHGTIMMNKDSRVEGLRELGELFERAGRFSSHQADGRMRVARFERLGEGDFVEGKDARRNTDLALKAQAGEGVEMIAAAGGFCGPAEAVTEIQRGGRTDTPVTDLIPTIRARGEYRYLRQVPLASVDAGIDYWTEADDILVPIVPKPCYHLACETELVAKIICLPMCFQYGTGQEWSNPEQVAATLALFDVAMARRTEALTMQRIHEQSNQYTFVPPIGTSVQNGLVLLIADLLQLPAANGRHSLDGYVLVIPEQMMLQVEADAAQKAWVGPTLTRTQIVEQLEDLFGIRVVTSPDVRALQAVMAGNTLPTPPAPAGGALPCPHNKFEILLFKPEDYRHGVNQVDIVIGTDITTARNNDKSVFLEACESTEKFGSAPSFSVLYDGLGSLMTGAQPDLVAIDAAYCAADVPVAYTYPGAVI